MCALDGVRCLLGEAGRVYVYGRTYACMYVCMNIILYVLINVCGSERWTATFATHPRANLIFQKNGGMPRPTRDPLKASATHPEETATLTLIGSAGVIGKILYIFDQTLFLRDNTQTSPKIVCADEAVTSSVLFTVVTTR